MFLVKLSITIVLSSIFILLSILHIYWAFGGKWGAASVVPTKEVKSEVNMPGPIGTLFVALGLALFSVVVIMQWFTEDQLPFTFLIPFKNYGIQVIAVIFFLRSVGDFKYVGLFRKIKHTPFAQMDKKLFTPLSGLICILLLILVSLAK